MSVPRSVCRPHSVNTEICLSPTLCQYRELSVAHIVSIPRSICRSPTQCQYRDLSVAHSTQSQYSHESTNKQIPSEASEEPSDTVIHLKKKCFSSSTGELCSQPIRGNDRRIGRMFPEHVERSFLDPEYSFDEYFQLGSRRKIGPVKNQLASPNTSN